MNENRMTLKRTLKPHWVWAIALGSSIGWGAFVQPTNWIKEAGPMGVIIGFLIGAMLMMLIAVSYGILIKYLPVSGGEFAYTFFSFGRIHAFICGWFLSLGYICIVALNASAFSLMLKYIFPEFIEQFKLYQLADWDVYITEILVAILVLLIFGYLNIIGTKLSGRVQFYFCVMMLLSVSLITVLVGISPDTSIHNLQPSFVPNQSMFFSVISIVAIAPWAFVGFDNIPQTAEEFNFNSKKAFGLIIFALFAAFLLYSLMVISTAMTMPWQELVKNDVIWGTGTAIQGLLGSVGLVLLVVALSMGIFTGLNGFIVSSSRLLFAMSRAKMLPTIFSRLHPKHQTPYFSIVFTILIAMIAPWFGREVLLWIVDMSSIGVSIAYFYTCLTAYDFLKRKTVQRTWRNQLKRMITIIGVIASLTFIGLLLVPGSPAFLGKESRIALIVWTILGVMIYFIKRKDYHAISQEELNYLILGQSNKSKF